MKERGQNESLREREGEREEINDDECSGVVNKGLRCCSFQLNCVFFRGNSGENVSEPQGD